jgi:hypothetical protein
MKKTRQNKKLSLRSDLIGTEALRLLFAALHKRSIVRGHNRLLLAKQALAASKSQNPWWNFRKSAVFGGAVRPTSRYYLKLF